MLRALDKGTGKEQHVTITSSTNMSKEDIEKAVKEAEKFAEEDKKFKELVDAKNQAESMISQSEKVISEAGDKISEDDKQALRAEADSLKEAVKSDNVDTIKSGLESFQKKFFEVSEKLYKNAGGPVRKTAAQVLPARRMRMAASTPIIPRNKRIMMVKGGLCVRP